MEIADPRTGAIDIWIEDLARGVRTRLTSGKSTQDSPVWSPDGSQIVFTSDRNGHFDLFRKSSDGAGNDEPLLASDDSKGPTDWSADGRFIAFDRVGPKPGDRREVWAFSVPDRRAFPILQTVFNESSGRFSPDGHWLAYCSDNSGRSEVYVRPFPERGAAWRISVDGGTQPVWRSDGKELFYVSADRRLMAVPVTMGNGLELGRIEALFEIPLKSSASDIALFDVSAGVPRFLVNTPAERQTTPPVTVVVDWAASLAR